jgi:predicted dehydrogenase
LKKYNVGIIGSSWAATAHIDAIKGIPQAQVTDVWSSRTLDARELSERHGCPIRTPNDLATMLANPDIHVVDITGYPNQHAEHFVLAARNGKHIIVSQ